MFLSLDGAPQGCITESYGHGPERGQGLPGSSSELCSQLLGISSTSLSSVIQQRRPGGPFLGRLMFRDLWLLSYALLSHALIYSPCPTHNHPWPHQTSSCRARCTEPGKHAQEHVGLPHPTTAGMESPAQAGRGKSGVCLLPHLPSAGGGAGREAPWLTDAAALLEKEPPSLPQARANKPIKA